MNRSNNLDKIYDEMKLIKKDNLENFIENYNDETPIETLMFVAHDIFKYYPTSKIIKEKNKRQQHEKFKTQLEKKYGKCIISGDDVEICNACHIIQFAESDNANLFNVNNGLLLSASLQMLFDKYLLSINESGIVVLSNKVLSKDTFSGYHKYNGLQLKLNSLTLKNIATHYKKFLETNK